MGLRVLVCGAGIGGLALAQGLRRAGVEVRVFERDPSADARRQGYRLHIDDDGGAALRRCLPEQLFELFRLTSNRPGEHPRVSVLDHRLDELFTQDVGGPDVDRDSMHTAVDRLVLRQILLADLDDVVEFGREVRDVEPDDEGVTAHLAGGGTERADVLVAADGVGSALRARLSPAATVVDTGLRVIYGKTALTPARTNRLPARLFDGFTGVVGPDGRTMALGTMRPRLPVVDALAALGRSDLPITPLADYLMWAVVAPATAFPVTDDALFRARPADLTRCALGSTADWHPVLRWIIEQAEAESCFPIAIRTCTEVTPPPPGRATLLGDAIHPMPPAGGAGANTALHDAALLTEHLQAAATGRTDVDTALARYCAEMHPHATAAVRRSLHNARLEQLLP